MGGSLCIYVYVVGDEIYSGKIVVVIWKLFFFYIDWEIGFFFFFFYEGSYIFGGLMLSIMLII